MAKQRIGKVKLGSKPRIIVPIVGENKKEILAEVAKISKRKADIVEWRIDHFESCLDPSDCFSMASKISSRAGLPILATFRTHREGGTVEIDGKTYRRLLRALAQSDVVDAIDVEMFFEEAEPEKIIEATHRTGCVAVGSYHDFSGTPERAEIVDRIVHMAEMGADVVKFSCMPHTMADVATLLAATAEAKEKVERPIITMSMGRLGIATRSVGFAFGSVATFAAVEKGEESAPGQVPLDELKPVLSQLRDWYDD